MYRVFLFLSGGSSSELAICKELAPVASVSPTFNFKSSKSNFIFQRTFFDFTKFLPSFSNFDFRRVGGVFLVWFCWACDVTVDFVDRFVGVLGVKFNQIFSKIIKRNLERTFLFFY